MSAVAEVEEWVRSFVVELSICPFAKAALARTRFVEVGVSTLEGVLLALGEELQHLLNHPEVSNTLLVCPQVLRDFDDFLDAVALGELALDEAGLLGELQLASFHPDYCFEGAARSDPANATNRAPHPVLHLLREAEIEEAVAHHPDPDAIWARNVALLRGKAVAET